jgi:kynureninase
VLIQISEFGTWRYEIGYFNKFLGIGGAFIHQKHFEEDLPRLAGWWGTDEKVKFEMVLIAIPSYP